MWNVSTNTLAYQLNGAIGEPDTSDNSWFVWLGYNSSEAPPVAPTPELNPIIIVLAGRLGMLLISRKHKGNFS